MISTHLKIRLLEAPAPIDGRVEGGVEAVGEQQRLAQQSQPSHRMERSSLLSFPRPGYFIIYSDV